MTVKSIEDAVQNSTVDGELRELSEVSTEEMKDKLPQEYYEFLDVFDKSKANELPSHRNYDQKIELEPGFKPPSSRIHPMSGFKLQKVKAYLEENIQKGSISPSTAPYVSSVLFVQKKDGSLDSVLIVES